MRHIVFGLTVGAILCAGLYALAQRPLPLPPPPPPSYNVGELRREAPKAVATSDAPPKARPAQRHPGDVVPWDGAPGVGYYDIRDYMDIHSANR